jgi:hypothetical protein
VSGQLEGALSGAAQCRPAALPGLSAAVERMLKFALVCGSQTVSLQKDRTRSWDFSGTWWLDCPQVTAQKQSCKICMRAPHVFVRWLTGFCHERSRHSLLPSILHLKVWQLAAAAGRCRAGSSVAAVAAAGGADAAPAGAVPVGAAPGPAGTAAAGCAERQSGHGWCPDPCLARQQR